MKRLVTLIVAPSVAARQRLEGTAVFYKASGKYGCFSNLYKCPVSFEGVQFPSAEHAYQYGKPKHADVRHWIMAAPNTANVAGAGHCPPPEEVVPNWNRIKVGRMAAVIKTKFGQGDDTRGLREKLLGTDDMLIIEDSRSDSFWGAGKDGLGQNVLGQLLMQRRDVLLGRVPRPVLFVIPSSITRARAVQRAAAAASATPATTIAAASLINGAIAFDVHDSLCYLSNYFEREFIFEERHFPTAEHAFQFGKLAKPELAEWLMACPTRLFRYAKNAAVLKWDVRRDWSKIKLARLARLKAVLLAKFTQHADLQSELLKTAPSRIVAIRSLCKRARISKYRSDQVLAELLMQVRAELLATDGFTS